MFEVRKVETKHDYAWTVILRYQVFSCEQGFDPKFDIDEREDESIYYLALENNKPVGTARYRILENQAKIEAMVVLKSHRNMGYASKILNKIHSDLRHSNLDAIYLNAMVEAEEFYKKNGYVREGDVFRTPANAPHYKMVLKEN